MDNALLSFFLQDKDLITDNRPLRLRLAHPTQMLEDVLLPQHVQGTESICGSLEYRILCVSLDAFIPLKELIALPVAVDIVTDRGDLRSICGIVTEARAGDSDGGLASYQLVMRDALSIMEKRTNTRVFRNKNEVEIVEVILDEWRTTNPIIGTCFRYEKDDLFGHQQYPQREFTMQYNESDAAFIKRLLKRRGIAWYFRADQSNSPSHTMVLFNHPDSLPPNAAGVVRYHRDDGTEERDSITSWCAVRTLQPASVTRFSWDYKRPQTPGLMFATAQGNSNQGETGNQMAASLDDYQVLSPHAGDDYDDLCQLGQLAMNRHDLDAKCFYGKGSVREMCVGEYFTLEGHPEIDSHSGSDCDFVVTSMHASLSNNLSKELAKRVFGLFAHNRWIEGGALAAESRGRYLTRNEIAFTAVRRDIQITPSYDARLDIPNVPMQSAIVVGAGDDEVHCDELGRVKVRFRTTRDSDHEHAQGAGASESDTDSSWIRVATNWAGSGPGSTYQCGGIHLPRVGAEVLVAFLSGDPDRPIIVGQVFNEQGKPPALSNAGGLPGNRFLSGLRSKEIGGSQGNRLRFDDTKGEISVQIGSDHGSSKLSMGFITHERSDGIGGKRGEGIELATQLAASLRGESGVLIASASFESTKSEVLDAGPCLSAAKLAHGVHRHLAQVAERSSEDGGAEDSLGGMVTSLERWREGSHEKVVAISSSSGIVAGASETIVLASKLDLHSSSGRDTNFGAGGSLFARAAQGISVLACKIGIKLVAAGGDIKIRSQNDSIEITASKKIKLVANEQIELHSPAIKLIAQGTQADYGGGKITQQSSGSHTIRSSKFDHLSAGDGTPEKFNVPNTEVTHDQQVQVLDLKTEEPLANRRYRIKVEDGKSYEGVTDEQGLTERFRTKVAFAQYEIELID
ncbi:type VI secretion system Vgr family protein [Pseudoduganella sp. OTU4001]|uniref:type VI secretion system Vgr family protein n=1 Tax=Pseudoduganella sp. OTU4001 TaxID=3043854 RepID=UPI00313E2B41